jgi:phosphatidylserine/phosphatidylglycerophosphate/cardiolipin synthase-like enzyme
VVDEAGSGAYWRRDRAARGAVFIDMEGYFIAAREAMLRARRSIWFVNWAFEANTPFDPGPGGQAPPEDRIGPFLKRLADEKPELDVRILCWDSALPVAATQNFFPIVDTHTFRGSRVRFVLDDKVPLGACHHQKMIVIDDAIAFCGGGDIGPDRWDTPDHRDDDPRRIKTRADNRCFDSRHEVMAIVDGEAARSLADLFRQRWARATGEVIPEPWPSDSAAPDPAAAASGGPADPWPPEVRPAFRDVQVGISRTMPRWRGEPGVREIEQLTLVQVARARRSIYMENQYFTSPLLAEALAARLVEPDGPEVVLVSTQHSPSYFDQITMDRTRAHFFARLRAVDRHGRFFAYSPLTALARTIIVHAKVAIVDDEVLRIGSANMNNRSAGFDTECDLSFEAEGRTGAETADAIAAIRTRLVAHWLGCDDALVDATVAREGGLGRGIEALRAGGRTRLRPIPSTSTGPLARLIAYYHLGDPVTAFDSWRPWRRREQIAKDMKRLEALRPYRHPPVPRPHWRLRRGKGAFTP